MNIAIITPAYGELPGSYLDCFINLMANAPNYGVYLIKPENHSNVTQARNICVQKVHMLENQIEQKIDYLFWVDSDIVYEPNIFERLMLKIRTEDYDALSGVYFTKRIPSTPVAGVFDINRIETGLPHLTDEHLKSAEVMDIDWAGMGFVVIKREILDEMGYPWFDMEVVEECPISKKKYYLKISLSGKSLKN
jgi:glycosyltransferase involved in cell wall biosynthesis